MTNQQDRSFTALLSLNDLVQYFASVRVKRFYLEEFGRRSAPLAELLEEYLEFMFLYRGTTGRIGQWKVPPYHQFFDEGAGEAGVGEGAARLDASKVQLMKVYAMLQRRIIEAEREEAKRD